VVTSTAVTAKTYPAAAKQFGDCYYSVTIDKSNPTNPAILAKGFVPAPYSTTQQVSRVVQVVTKPRATFPVKAPMVVLQGFDANGNNVATDSFNSTNGPYSSAPHGTSGDIVTLSGAPGSIK